MPSHLICRFENWTLNPSPGLITGRFQCRDMGTRISVWHTHFHKPLPHLIFHLLSHSASFLLADKWPLINTAPCPPPVVRSSSDILGENQMDSHKFYASSLMLAALHSVLFPVWRLSRGSHVLWAFWEEIQTDCISAKIRQSLLHSKAFLLQLSVCVFVRKHLVQGNCVCGVSCT